MNTIQREYFISCVLQRRKSIIENKDIIDFIHSHELKVTNSDKYNRFKIIEIIAEKGLLEDFYNCYNKKIFLSIRQIKKLINIDKKILITLFYAGCFPNAYCKSSFEEQTYFFPISILELYLWQIKDKYKKIISNCVSNRFVLRIQEKSLESLQKSVKDFNYKKFCSQIQVISINIKNDKEPELSYFSYIPITFENLKF